MESELESESIFSGWSRSWSRSRLKFVDSAALDVSAPMIGNIFCTSISRAKTLETDAWHILTVYGLIHI